MREEGGIQKSIFYVSRVLKSAKIRYMNIKKLVFTLLLAVKKFKMHLEDYQRIMMANQPLKRILHKLKALGRMLTWSIVIS